MSALSLASMFVVFAASAAISMNTAELQQLRANDGMRMQSLETTSSSKDMSNAVGSPPVHVEVKVTVDNQGRKIVETTEGARKSEEATAGLAYGTGELKKRADKQYFEELFIEQPVDWFSDAPNKQQYRQRYWVYNKWCTDGGPVFFHTSGQDAVDKYWDRAGFVFELAETLKGCVVFPEHRYFGNSVPGGKDTGKDLAYLTIEQAMKDFVKLIESFREQKSWRHEGYQDLWQASGSWCPTRIHAACPSEC